MSTLWVLGLGASLGYLQLKSQTLRSNLDTAVSDYQKKDGISGTDATLAVRQKAWSNTDDVKLGDFNERLPKPDRAKILRVAEQQQTEVEQYESSTVPVVGVWLEGRAS